MSQRFFFQADLSDEARPGQLISLDSQESHHLIHVMRAKVGDSISLFDGTGMEYESCIQQMNRNEVVAEIVSAKQVCRELGFELTIVVPLPKADRQKFLVEKLTEIGATQLLFLTTSRSSVKSNAKSLSKLERTVIEASKQCGRNRLMKIKGPADFQDLIDDPEKWEINPAHEMFFAHPNSDPWLTGSVNSGKGKVMLIGPEGGLSDDEVSQLKNSKWKGVGFGKSILRMETAAMVSASLLAFEGLNEATH